MVEAFSDYALVRFGPKSAATSDFLRALDIYSAETAKEIRTDTNEIVYWLGRYDAEFDGDKLLLFGLYKGGDIIGFAQAVHLKSARIIIVDYMAICRSSRRHNVFFQFVDMIYEWTIGENLCHDYIVVEVSTPKDPLAARRAGALIRALNMAGFATVDAPYLHPKLGSQGETEASAKLLVKPNIAIASISTSEYIRIVRSIYYDHYIRWYSKIFAQGAFDEYKRSVDKDYETVRAVTSNREAIALSGAETDFDCGHAKTETDIGALYYKAFLMPSAVVAASIAGLVYVKSKFNMSTSDILSIAALSAAIVVVFLSIIYRNAADLMRDSVRTAIRFFGK